MKMKILWAALFAGLPAVVASPITFTISTSAGGTLGSTVFSDNTITFTETTDTSLIVFCFGGFALCAPASTSNTVTIGGLGTFTINDSTEFFTSAFNRAGLTDLTLSADVLTETDAAFGSYNLETALGPIFDSIYSNSLSPISTSGGTLSYLGNSADAAFTAVTSGTPEPGSFGLLAAGAVSLGLFGWRKRK